MLKVFMENDEDFTFCMKTQDEEEKFITDYLTKGLKRLKVKGKVIDGKDINNIQFFPDKSNKKNLNFSKGALGQMEKSIDLLEEIFK